ncbi:MAG: hypothetical protein IIV23_04155 [Ruminococcus sp.]|nr:hypothetical protein [Ruminococcus sp.]
MEIIVKGTQKEIAALVLATQRQQSKASRLALWKVLSKLCDEFNLHDDETDAVLESLME